MGFSNRAALPDVVACVVSNSWILGWSGTSDVQLTVRSSCHLAVGALATALAHFLPAREEPHALVAAAAFGHVDPLRFMLREGFPPDAGAAESGEPSPLLVACAFGHVDVAALLLDRKANVEHRAKTGLTPLMEAASGGYTEVGHESSSP